MKFKIGQHLPLIAVGLGVTAYIWYNHRKAKSEAMNAGYYQYDTPRPDVVKSYNAGYYYQDERPYRALAAGAGEGGGGGHHHGQGGQGHGQTQTQTQTQPVQCSCPDGSISTASLAYVPHEFLETPQLTQAYLSYAYASHKGKGGKGGHGKGGKGGHGKAGKGGKGKGKGGKAAGGKGKGGGGAGGGGAADAGGGGGGGQDAGEGGGGGGGQDQGGQGGADQGGQGAAGQGITGGNASQPVLTCNCPNPAPVADTSGVGPSMPPPSVGGMNSVPGIDQTGDSGMPLPPASVPSMGPGMGPGMFDPTTNQWVQAGTGQPVGNLPPQPMAFAAHNDQGFNLVDQQDEDLYDDYSQVDNGYIQGTTYAGGYYPYDEDSSTTPPISLISGNNWMARPSNLF